MTSHSLYFSPSSLARRIACHGSARMEEQAPPEPPSANAERGSYCHHIKAEWLTKGIPPEDWVGKEMYGQVCDQEMADDVRKAIGDLHALTGGVGFGSDYQVETRVSLTWLGYPEVYGTADFVQDELFGVLTVEDDKYGGVPVSPELNPQLMTYALGAAGEALPSYSAIRLAISQPKTHSGPSLKVWEVSPATLLEWFHDVLEPALLAIMAGDMTLNPSESACRWCKAVRICPAYTRLASELARQDFAGQIEPPVIDDALVSHLYPQLGLLEGWIKQVRKHAYGMACEGTLPGYKLVAGRKSRGWKNENDAVALLQDELGIDPYTRKLLSPAQAEKATDKDGRKQLQALIQTAPGKPTIAADDDARPAVSAAFEDFKEILQIGE